MNALLIAILVIAGLVLVGAVMLWPTWSRRRLARGGRRPPPAGRR